MTPPAQVLEFKYTGEYVGVFANVSEPRGLLHLPALDPPQVAVCSGGDGEVKFFSMDGAATGNITEGELIPHDVSISLGPANEIMVAYVDTNGMTLVRAECVPGQQCAQDTSTSELAEEVVDPCACVSVTLSLLNIIIRAANPRNRVTRAFPSQSTTMDMGALSRLLVAAPTESTSEILGLPGASSASSARKAPISSLTHTVHTV